MVYMNQISALFIVYLAFFDLTDGAIISIEDHGALAGDDSKAALNSKAIEDAFSAAVSGDVVLVPQGKVFTITGTTVTNVSNVVFQMDGTLKASSSIDDWPKSGKSFLHILHFVSCKNMTFTSSSEPTVDRPTLDGQGYNWWWREILQTLPADRPKAFVLSECDQLVIENLVVKDSPSWTIVLDDVSDVLVQNTRVQTDVDAQKELLRTGGRALHVSELFPNVPWKDWLADLLMDLFVPTFPLNTDGIDITGRNVHVRNVTIINFDDSIVPKPSHAGMRNNCTENILIEDIVAVGVGMAIGSVPPNDGHNCVNNVTMRNVKMPNTMKGIYVKTNPGNHGTGIISNIVYENFEITRPYWWAIWIGPQQQNQPGWNSTRQECRLDYPISKICPSQPLVVIQNLTLRNIEIKNPLLSPGVIRCNETRYDKPGHPSCENIVFDGVRVTGSSTNIPYGLAYKCWNVEGMVTNNSNPVPNCGGSFEIQNPRQLMHSLQPELEQE